MTHEQHSFGQVVQRMEAEGLIVLADDTNWAEVGGLIADYAREEGVIIDADTNCEACAAEASD